MSVETPFAGIDIKITIIQGKDLVAKDRAHAFSRKRTTSDPYVAVFAGAKYFGQTAAVQKSLNPKWADAAFNIRFGPETTKRIIDGDKKAGELKFIIYDRDIFTDDDPMGTVIVPISIDGPPTSTQWYEVGPGSGNHRCSNASGELQIKVAINKLESIPPPHISSSVEMEKLEDSIREAKIKIKEEDEEEQTDQSSGEDQKMCRMGCGFFGTKENNGCCSKCWEKLLRDDTLSTVETKEKPSSKGPPTAVSDGGASAVYRIKEHWGYGDNFTVYDKKNIPQYLIKGTPFDFKSQLMLTEFLGGKELALIRRSGPKAFTFYRSSDDCFAYIVKSFGSKFTLSFPTNQTKDSYTIAGYFFGHEFTFYRKGKPVASISKQRYSWSDTYGVEINAGEDVVLILSACICIDQVLHD